MGHPDVDEVIAEPALAGAWWRQAWRVSRLWRSWHLETIIVANPKKAYHAGAWLAGIPRRVGWNCKGGWLLTHRLEDRKRLGDRHEVEYNLDLVRALGCPTPPPPTVWLPQDDAQDRRIAQLVERQGLRSGELIVAVHPWTSNPRKQWSLPRMREVMERLRRLPGVRLAVIGGAEERTASARLLAPPVAGLAESEPLAWDLVGRLSLKELAALLRRVRLLLSNDSGPMHVAAAVGTPVVALFGTADPGSHPRRWGPWGEGHTVIHKPLEAISVEEVCQAVTAYLRR